MPPRAAASPTPAAVNNWFAGGLGSAGDAVRLGRRLSGRAATAAALAEPCLGLAGLGRILLSLQSQPRAGGIGALRADPGGLPVGLQIAGPRLADALVLRAAKAFLAAQPFTVGPAQ